jgi:hypothetical protein
MEIPDPMFTGMSISWGTKVPMGARSPPCVSTHRRSRSSRCFETWSVSIFFTLRILIYRWMLFRWLHLSLGFYSGFSRWLNHRAPSSQSDGWRISTQDLVAQILSPTRLLQRINSNHLLPIQWLTKFLNEIQWLRVFHLVHSSTTLWTGESTVQMFSWTMGIYGPRIFTAHEDTGKPSGKAFNTLPYPSNQTVVGKPWICRRILVRRFDIPSLSCHLGFLIGSLLLI